MSWIFAVFLILLLGAVVFVLYTRRGSGISQRPMGAEDPRGPGVAEGASRLSSTVDEAKAPRDVENRPPERRRQPIELR